MTPTCKGCLAKGLFDLSEFVFGHAGGVVFERPLACSPDLPGDLGGGLAPISHISGHSYSDIGRVVVDVGVSALVTKKLGAGGAAGLIANQLSFLKPKINNFISIQQYKIYVKVQLLLKKPSRVITVR